MICSKTQSASLSNTVVLSIDCESATRSMTTLPPYCGLPSSPVPPPLLPPLLEPPQPAAAMASAVTAARTAPIPVVRILMNAPSTVPRATFGSQPYQGRPQEGGIWITWIRNGGDPVDCGRRDDEGRRDRRGARAGDPVRRAAAGDDAAPGAARRAVRRQPHPDPRSPAAARCPRPRRLPPEPGGARAVALPRRAAPVDRCAGRAGGRGRRAGRDPDQRRAARAAGAGGRALRRPDPPPPGARPRRRHPPRRHVRVAAGERHVSRRGARGGRHAAPSHDGEERAPGPAHAAAPVVPGRPAPPRREPAPAPGAARGAAGRERACGPRAHDRPHPGDGPPDRRDPRPHGRKRPHARGGADGHVTYVVVGAGAIGGTVAAGLVRDGHDVLVCDADPEHVAAINRDGLAIEGPVEAYTVHLPAVAPEELPAELDHVLLAVKAHHTRD